MPRLVGLLPAAGHAERLGRQPTSKEMLPISSRPVIDFALAAMARAGIDDVVVVIRDAKTDLRRHLESRRPGARPGVSWLSTSGTRSIPETLDVAHEAIVDARVVLAFPDVCFQPSEALAALLRRHEGATDDVSLALFRSARPDKTDMVELAAHDGRVAGFRVKPGPCELEHTWLAAVWEPRFTAFLRSFLTHRSADPPPAAELQMSQVFAAALGDGFSIGALTVVDGRFVDVGTPEDLAHARETW